MYKTNPSLTEINLIDSDNYINVNDIITNLNNIIYKRYSTYGTLNFKKIIDKIYQIEKNNFVEPNTNKVIVITSINDTYLFTESNIKYINDLLDQIKSNVQFINVSNSNILKYTFPKINEFFININNYKTENIFEKSTYPFEFLNFNYDTEKLDNLIGIKDILIKDILIKEKQNEINNNLVLNISTNQIVLKSIIILYGFIEVNIKEFKTKIDDLNKIKIIMSLEVDTGNKYINNTIKSMRNSINDIIYRLSDSIIKLPTDKLDLFLSESYIKYILEFYEIIYPKIYKFNISIDSYVKKQNNKNFTLSPIQTKPIDNVKTDVMSTQYLTSTLSLTNWVEEYNNYNPFGFLIKYKPNKLSYRGILDINSSICKTYPNIIIEQVTTNWVSLYDYYQIVLTELNSENNNNDITDSEISNHTDIFNIGNFNIVDNIQGDGNILLPVYINKNHWELTKSIWTYHMSFINNCFEFEYNKKMDNIYFYTLLKLFSDIKQIGQPEQNGQNFKSVIRLFCYVLRTTIQILLDNKYLHSIKKDYPKFFDLILKTESFDKNSNFSDWVMRLIQLMISNECEQTQLENDLKKITDHIFTSHIISNYKMDFWERINDEKTTVQQKLFELEDLKNSALQNNICWLYLEFDLRLLNKVIKSIYQLKGFNQFIKIIDSTNGCVSDLNSDSSEQINLTNITNVIKQVCLEQFNPDYYKVDISKYTTIE